MTTTPRIFHLCPRSLWDAALARDAYYGRPADIADGYIHCSTAEQVQASAAKHAAGEADLLLLSIDPDRLGESLRWEPSRKGELFPHIYGGMPVGAVVRADPLPLDSDGVHQFPAWLVDTTDSR
ncbi:MAG: DUF952 domain-containing protein [Alphaproteobacteria bacterium]|nr:DUF952 domain-containing protein [Alphaproteobacteria bacterium]